MPHTCDYLIIGGGSAGCVVTRRLAEKTAGRIVLLEAGNSDEGDAAATDLSRLDEQTPAYDWGFTASAIKGAPPQLNYARAKLLGGCANHNDCAFLRPPPSDFDQWQSLGATGWNAAAMAPCYDRVMTMITVEPSPQHPISRAFVDAAIELDFDEVDFSQEIRQGAGWFPLNARGRARQSSSIAYLHPLSHSPKHLEVWTNTVASKLIVANGKAIGAETSRGMIHASRAVILTAGAIQTPQLLMVSGMGPAAHLRELGIAVIADLPHVGRHLRDHVAAPIVWETREPVAPWDICPFEATLLLKLEDDAPAPDILFHFGLRVREKYNGGPRLAVDGPAVKASPNVARPRSEGSVRLASADFRVKPLIDLNYLSHPGDLALLLKAMRFTRALARTNSFNKICKAEIHPGPQVETDDQWLSYIRNVCETVYHPCGTAAIGRVVDPGLRVYGIANLYVADASIFPSMITVNINCAVMMAAEKAADLIAEKAS